ncbi:hypothetical protein ALC57_17058 [Trachymyrmex cornetzi]|uniref:Uncharacterized protein n=1 Tax=Trachymyrmex cornetzi TaxID=471704 RepID=A0A195DD97_9HYME|nr:hypothetical protein ALC57_17058 [Trachymyrmex cornetzi]
MLRTANPKDFKNVTFDALSFFLMERVLSSCDVTKHLTLALSLLSSYVQSNGDLFSSKIEQSSVLVDDAYCQIRNAPCDDRQEERLRVRRLPTQGWIDVWQ